MAIPGDRYRLFRKLTHWLLAAALILYIVTGFGITEFRTVDAWTFGVLDKATSMKIHNGMEWPFVALLALHIIVSLIYNSEKEQAGAGRRPAGSRSEFRPED
jgi:cytochrome b561